MRNQQGSNPAIDLLDKLSQRVLDIDNFLVEVTKLFCATHELEIDMLMHVHEAVQATGTGTTTALPRLEFDRFAKAVPLLGMTNNKLAISDFYLQCSRGQQSFVDCVLDNTSRFVAGAYQPLIKNCSDALTAILV